MRKMANMSLEKIKMPENPVIAVMWNMKASNSKMFLTSMVQSEDVTASQNTICMMQRMYAYEN